jgi:hypothetical protein
MEEVTGIKERNKETNGGLNMSLLNMKSCVTEALNTAKRYKGGVTQVSQSWKDELEQDVRVMIFRKVMAHKKGKTLKPNQGV